MPSSMGLDLPKRLPFVQYFSWLVRKVYRKRTFFTELVTAKTRTLLLLGSAGKRKKPGRLGGRAPGAPGGAWWGQSYIIHFTHTQRCDRLWVWRGSCGSNMRELSTISPPEETKEKRYSGTQRTERDVQRDGVEK